MQESFIHFLWKFQYFDKYHLTTVHAEPIQVLHPGNPNTDAGPDFNHARIMVDGIEWAGNVEIHIKSSDWIAHEHHTNKAYDNVVLHVVWQADRDIYRNDGTLIPTLELANKANLNLLNRYKFLLESQDSIPCASQFNAVGDIYKMQALDKALMQRLQQKAAFVKELLLFNQNDWEATTYQLLARNLGFKINSEPFLALAKALPLKLLQKHSHDLLQMEALLFGQAGFLEGEYEDAYRQSLQKEYAFLCHKYGLSSARLPLHMWKFLRLRPANFPTLRIAHLAALLQKHKNIFTHFIHSKSLKDITALFTITPSLYWQTHYIFDKSTKATVQMGKTNQENILINTVVPLLVCYAKEKGNHMFLEKAIEYLENLPAEDNQITRLWQQQNLVVKTAFDSQASIELYNHFCTQKRCLTCPVGVSLLRE